MTPRTIRRVLIASRTECVDPQAQAIRTMGDKAMGRRMVKEAGTSSWRTDE